MEQQKIKKPANELYNPQGYLCFFEVIVSNLFSSDNLKIKTHYDNLAKILLLVPNDFIHEHKKYVIDDDIHINPQKWNTPNKMNIEYIFGVSVLGNKIIIYWYIENHNPCKFNSKASNRIVFDLKTKSFDEKWNFSEINNLLSPAHVMLFIKSLARFITDTFKSVINIAYLEYSTEPKLVVVDE